MESWLLLAIALIAANLPFVTENFLFFKSFPIDKPLGWRLLELVLLYFAVGGLAFLLEQKSGEMHGQNWEFFAITISLFLVLAFPGFVYRYLWRRKGV